ncbi:MAG: protein translocase subunit SecF [Gammaproteobacteria bacterium]|nr:protein translocase subunit SecF [Gammaproteobacteria bacterium]
MSDHFHFNLMGKRKIALILSTLLIVVSIASLALRGLVLGIDFTGGTLVEIGYPDSVDPETVRSQLVTGGFDDASVQHFGSSKDILIRLPSKEGRVSAELSTRIMNVVKTGESASAELRRIEFVGPQVGEELRENGGLAMLYAIFGILLYVAWRFEYRFSLGAVAALVHDVIITLGFFSVFALEFDLSVLAAILAVIGYSLNDTIVVFDRIRENFRRMRKGRPVEVMNVSLNQTLTRTIITSLTTLLVLIALVFLGGEIIHNFAVALIVGVLIGTYSSIYVASPVVLALGVSKEDLMPPEREGDEFEDWV